MCPIKVTRYHRLGLMGTKVEEKPRRKEILHSIPGVYVPTEWYFSLSPALGTFYYSTGKLSRRDIIISRVMGMLLLMVSYSNISV